MNEICHPLITVFTPTYNRISLLPRLLESLLKQTNKNFEWLVVDDGSSDGTEKYFNDVILKKQSTFPIRYYLENNGGKHTAINRGVKEAKGELFLILDSDDSLPCDAIETILKNYDLCKEWDDCGGVCGLMAHHDGKRIGNGFPKDTIYESSLVFRYHMGVTGDLSEVFKTSVMREFPFPEIEGEKFCPEALVWNRIASKYKLSCFNKVVYYADYLGGGLTDKIVKIRMESPIATTMTYQEMTEYDIPLKWKIRSAINYWRFKFCAKSTKDCPPIDYKWIWTMPLGLIMHFTDKKKISKRT